MKHGNFFFALLITIGLFTSSAFASQTWYVRPDGGTRYSANVTNGECNGTSDAPYPNNGLFNQPCAFNDYRFLYTDKTYSNFAWTIGPSDTVIIRGGPYRLGYSGPNSGDWAGGNTGDPYGPANPTIPSGVPGAPTRILGENYASCTNSNMTQLYGGYGTWTPLDLRGTHDVEVQCLELTDHSSCTRIGSPQPNPCNSNYPISDYAGTGILTDANSSDILLKNLNVHGFTGDGINGPIGGLITVDHVRLGFNGAAGWDFDDGNGTPSMNNPTINASYLTVEGSGCNEEYPIVHKFPAASCYDQSSSGYGDNIGTPNTELNFSCDHCTIRYGTQDGLDLLHTSGSNISITNSTSYGNMGQQWKFGAMSSVLFEDNLTVHNCKRMSQPIQDSVSPYNQYLSLFCRAAGDGFAMSIIPQGTYTIINNSFVGYGTTTYDLSCNQGATCNTSNIIFDNNLHIGYASPIDGKLPGIFYYGAGLPANPFKEASNNIYFNMRSLPTQPNSVGTDPHVLSEPPWPAPTTDGTGVVASESVLDAVDFHLTDQSVNAIAQGIPVGVLADYDGVTRPNPPSIGALDYSNAGASTTSVGSTSPATAPTTMTTTSPAPVVTWTKVAIEGETVFLPKGTTYRFGIGTSFLAPVTTTADWTVYVYYTNFGGDPAPGVTKELDVEGTGSGVLVNGAPFN